MLRRLHMCTHVDTLSSKQMMVLVCHQGGVAVACKGFHRSKSIDAHGYLEAYRGERSTHSFVSSVQGLVGPYLPAALCRPSQNSTAPFSLGVDKS
jgi:hypothetical protein